MFYVTKISFTYLKKQGWYKDLLQNCFCKNVNRHDMLMSGQIFSSLIMNTAILQLQYWIDKQKKWDTRATSTTRTLTGLWKVLPFVLPWLLSAVSSYNNLLWWLTVTLIYCCELIDHTLKKNKFKLRYIL